MASFQSPRGTRDILPADQAVWQHVISVAQDIARSMSFSPITTPTYEELGLFQRAIGEGTDVQDKEIFLVSGKHSVEGESKYALRPEGTAGIVRAYIEHGMHTWPQPVKLFSFVNNFRYDRPQKGRYREHVQFDIEYFGDKGPFADAWVIYTTWRLLKGLKLDNLELRLNNLGTSEERAAYLDKLVAFCEPLSDRLSEDSRRRLSTNPLRILDSKDANDRKLVLEAPQLADFLGEESRLHAETVLRYLTDWGIPVTADPFLVRGLDYYSQTAFEWVVRTSEGQQDSLGGGGRYDGLVTKLGGLDCGAVGAGMGLDRIVEEVIRQGRAEHASVGTPHAYIVAADEKGTEYARTSVIPMLLDANIRIDCNLSKTSLGSQMKSADRSSAVFAVIVGEAEVASQNVQLKELGMGGSQKAVALSDLVDELA